MGLLCFFLLDSIYGRKGDHATKMRNRAKVYLLEKPRFPAA